MSCKITEYKEKFSVGTEVSTNCDYSSPFTGVILSVKEHPVMMSERRFGERERVPEPNIIATVKKSCGCITEIDAVHLRLAEGIKCCETELTHEQIRAKFSVGDMVRSNGKYKGNPFTGRIKGINIFTAESLSFMGPSIWVKTSCGCEVNPDGNAIDIIELPHCHCHCHRECCC